MLSLTIALSLALHSPDLARLDAEARANAAEAHRAFAASHRYLDAWLAARDPETGLIPQNLESPLWTPWNSAADNYAFMVLTAYFTDPEVLAGEMRDMLDAEMTLSTRVRSLPDTVSLETDGFADPQVDMARAVFGASEYCKDGLLPIAEVMGPSPWFERLRELARDICLEAPVASDFGPLPSGGAEVNGEMLQVLTRLHAATGDPVYLDQALRIADAYFLEVLPGNGGVPCHEWDFAAHRAVNADLRVIDHGSEIIGGLSEAFVAARRHRPDRAAAYEEPFRRMLDEVLRRFVNQRGILSGRPDTAGGVPDTWGYVYNAYYTADMVLGEGTYLPAVRRAIEAATAYAEWGGADSLADCEEGAMVLLNRVDNPASWAWLSRLFEQHYAIQRPDGIVEGWHGDGNSARTWLMYAMRKTAGVRATPWSDALRYGAAYDGDALVLHLSSATPWKGAVAFDHPRHRDHMGLSMNYPRLNEWPEWWPVRSGDLYRVTAGETVTTMPGYRLIEGLPIWLAPGRPATVLVERMQAPPHGNPTVALSGPSILNCAPEGVAEVFVANTSDRAQKVALSASAGTLSQSALSLRPGERAAVTIRCSGDAESVIVAASPSNGRGASLRLRVLHEPGLLDAVAFSVESYKGVPYQWTGSGPIVSAVRLDGRQDVVLGLLWGSKNDEREAIVRLGDAEARVKHGGYDGFEWVRIPLRVSAASDETVLEIRAPDGAARGAFVSEIRVMRAEPE